MLILLTIAESCATAAKMSARFNRSARYVILLKSSPLAPEKNETKANLVSIESSVEELSCGSTFTFNNSTGFE